ncbi:MAG: hypothetical protein V7K53_27060 [Nostoc sp.]|uniref:hypothetical protein n=1 Tax=Nostoc sp. TaxID=1180 RepID=UPI002FFB0C02
MVDFTKRCLHGLRLRHWYLQILQFRCNYQNEWFIGSQWYSIVDGGTVDFFMNYGMDAVNAIATVTAIFKKDPWCLIAHPNAAIKILADLIFYSVKLKVYLTIYK